MQMYWNYVSVIIELCKQNNTLERLGLFTKFFLVEAIEDTKEKIPLKRNLQMHGFTMILQVWFYEYTNLYAHADEKCMLCIASWVNLYMGCKYDAAQLILMIKDNQIVPYLEARDLERREAIVKAFSNTEDFNAYVEDAQDEGGTADSDRGTDVRESRPRCHQEGAGTYEGIAYGQGPGG
ncbi:hypothetical protein Cgig2_026213 [Carnegiea gigantea]|uniref:Uncharacterized protein n=1 Tax=Carnegiea gigantea TaxID=171969 RepID=A0A9Q1JM27_9CARY|nr:hypothetical protein Cgig2_026213 [Carnegiea gigantea]